MAADSHPAVFLVSHDYPPDPSFIGRIVDVTAGLDTVTVTHDVVPIASRIRVWAGTWWRPPRPLSPGPQ